MSANSANLNKKNHSAGRVVGRGFLCLGVSFFSLLIFLFSAVAMINKGPSPAARDLLVSTAMETSAGKFLATWFFSEEEIEEILQANSVVPTVAVTDESLVHVPAADTPAQDQGEPLEIVDVTGATYKGKMMIVKDPSRVYVATPSEFGLESGGLRVEEMVKRDGAAAGVNGGGFADENGVGNGGQPLGIVITNGELKSGALSGTYGVIGLDGENRLVVGNMTAQQALDRGIRDAVSFGPILVVNGEAAQVGGSGGGLNPRTAIGQREDGAILLLVIDGRQPHSLGASFKDLIEVMVEFGAVNAANLDGGSSSLMVSGEEIITTCASLYGSRKIPTAFLVRQEGRND